MERRKNAVKPTESADAVMPMTVIGMATMFICGTATDRHVVTSANIETEATIAAAINERMGIILFIYKIVHQTFCKVEDLTR